MDIRSLLQFLQISKDGSYTRAAANLYLAQPTLSKTIHNLEEELGVPLFQKSKQQIELTDYGRKLVELATPIVNDFRSIPLWLHDIEDHPRGDVRVGTTPMIASLYLISQITPFCTLYPDINLIISEHGTNDILSMIQANECDIGLCMDGPAVQSLSNLSVYPLFSKEIVALIPNDDPLSTRASIRMSELRDRKFNIYTEGHAIKGAIFDRCKECGFVPQINFSSGNSSILIKLTESRSGITILPKPFLSVHTCDNLSIVSFEPVFPWNCCMVMKNHDTKASRFNSLSTI